MNPVLRPVFEIHIRTTYLVRNLSSHHLSLFNDLLLIKEKVSSSTLVHVYLSANLVMPDYFHYGYWIVNRCGLFPSTIYANNIITSFIFFSEASELMLRWQIVVVLLVNAAADPERAKRQLSIDDLISRALSLVRPIFDTSQPLQNDEMLKKQVKDGIVVDLPAVTILE
ncbi:hypothetical protein NECAME_08412 [Necator americanus]|uniref:Uncharacterized protein n=1 Tax=Necator americanus TaxID=51031 RepID=W2TJ40_NECAM|nr:hypothetical protein NECAME_08412 [Necator americanus]ETN81614.1 hypothetical protein NECAME_08412 [Necator americanus]